MSPTTKATALAVADKSRHLDVHRQHTAATRQVDVCDADDPVDDVHRVEGNDVHRVDVGPWRWAILRSGLPRTVRHVLLTIAVRMDSDGTIPRKFSPSTRTIAADCDRLQETVAEAIAMAAKVGYLTVEKGAGRRPNRYEATVPPSIDLDRSDPLRGGTTETVEALVPHLEGALGDAGGAVVPHLDSVVPHLGRRSAPLRGGHPALPAQNQQAADDQYLAALEEVKRRVAAGKPIRNEKAYARKLAADPTWSPNGECTHQRVTTFDNASPRCSDCYAKLDEAP